MANFGFTSVISADWSALNNAMKEIDSQSKKLNSELRQINGALKLDPGNATLAAQKLEVMGDAAKEAQKKLEQLRSQQEAMNRALQNGDISAEYYRQYQREIENARRTITDYNNALRNNKSGTDGANKSTADWVSTLKGMLASKILTEITSAIKGLADSAVEVGKNFDSAMSLVSATMGITAESDAEAFQTLKKAAEQMGATTKYTAAEAAEALNYLALAGYNAEEAAGALPTVLNLAQAGGMELAAASDMVTDSISALGLAQSDMTELTDKMAVTAQKSNTSVSQLGEAILTVGGTAKSVKGGLTEINTMLGVIADNGVKGAEGGTALRNIILSLTAPTDNAKAALEKLGIAIADDDGNMRELPEIFKDLNEALNEMGGNVDRTEVLNEIFNKVDLKSVNALLGTSSERFEELAGYIDDSSGAAEKMAETMNDNLEGALASCNSAFEAFEYSLYEKVSSPMKEIVKNTAGLISGITGELDEGAVNESVDKIAVYITEMMNGVSDIIESASQELMPVLLESINDSLREVSEAGGNTLIMFVRGLVESLPYLVEGALQIVMGLADALIEALPELTPATVDVVIKITETLIDNAPLMVDAAIKIIEALVEGLAKSIPRLLQEAPIIITKLIGALVDVVPALIYEVPNAIAQGIVDGLTEYDWKAGAEATMAGLGAALAEASGYVSAGSQEEAEARLEASLKELEKKRGEIPEKYRQIQEDLKKGAQETADKLADTSAEIAEAAGSAADIDVPTEESSNGGEESGVNLKSDMLDKALAELEHKYKTHKVTEEQYWAERKSTLEKYRDDDSEEWNELYDKVTEHYRKLSETEAKEREKALKEETSDAKKRFDALIEELKNEKITREQFNDEYAKLSEELARKKIDIAEYAADKIADYDEKVRKEEMTAWEKSSKEITDRITKTYDDVTKAYEKAKSQLISSAKLIDQKVTDTSGADRYILTDFEKKRKELAKYRKDLEKLKETGISEAHMEQIMSLSYDSGERQGYISELLKMNDKQRQAYYKDVNAYYADADKTAKLEVQDDLTEADRIAKEGIESIYGSMPKDAYQKGIETAQAYIDGINKTMQDADALRSMSSDFGERSKSAGLQSAVTGIADSVVSAAASNGQNGGFGADTKIVINVAGKDIIKATLGELMRTARLSDSRI